MSKRVVVYSESQQTVIFDALKHSNERYVGINHKERESKRVRVHLADIWQLVRQPRRKTTTVYYIDNFRPQQCTVEQHEYGYEILVAKDAEIRDTKAKRQLTNNDYLYENLVGTGNYLSVSEETFDKLTEVLEQYYEDLNNKLLEESKND